MESNKLNNDHPKDVFIDKLTFIVLDNLRNEQFGVSELAKEVGYSRSHLHRKLQEHSTQSISQFIREIRLNEALRLLREDQLTASEAAYRVGFQQSVLLQQLFSPVLRLPAQRSKNTIVQKKQPGHHRPHPHRTHMAIQINLPGSFRNRQENESPGNGLSISRQWFCLLPPS